MTDSTMPIYECEICETKTPNKHFCTIDSTKCEYGFLCDSCFRTEDPKHNVKKNLIEDEDVDYELKEENQNKTTNNPLEALFISHMGADVNYTGNTETLKEAIEKRIEWNTNVSKDIFNKLKKCTYPNNVKFWKYVPQNEMHTNFYIEIEPRYHLSISYYDNIDVISYETMLIKDKKLFYDDEFGYPDCLYFAKLSEVVEEVNRVALLIESDSSYKLPDDYKDLPAF